MLTWLKPVARTIPECRAYFGRSRDFKICCRGRLPSADKRGRLLDRRDHIRYERAERVTVQDAVIARHRQRDDRPHDNLAVDGDRPLLYPAEAEVGDLARFDDRRPEPYPEAAVVVDRECPAGE